MKRFEYKYVWNNLREEELVKLGEEGWEIVQGGNPSIFKREKPEIERYDYKQVRKSEINNIGIWELKDQGDDGWELCGIEQDVSRERIYIFKRKR